MFELTAIPDACLDEQSDDRPLDDDRRPPIVTAQVVIPTQGPRAPSDAQTRGRLGQGTSTSSVPPDSTRHGGTRRGTNGKSWRRLKVFSWWERDPVSLQELAFMVAVSSRREAHQARKRLALHGAASLAPIAPSHRGFAVAMERPGEIFWMTLDDYVALSRLWLREDQLAVTRVTALHRGG